MLELIFQGFMEWAYGLALECWEYFSSSLLDIMSMDYAYMKSHVPVMVSIAQVLLAVGWALLIIKHEKPITTRPGRKRDRLGFEMSLRQKECFPLSAPTPQEIERMSLKGR